MASLGIQGAALSLEARELLNVAAGPPLEEAKNGPTVIA